MKKVYSAQNPLLTGHVKNVLENDGIQCITRNEHLSLTIGEIPPIECWPEVWVVDDADFDKAQYIVKGLLDDHASPQEQWQCEKCHEKIEGQFTECWNCGASKNMDSSQSG